ncbi:MAG TPA: hypothetical protein VKV18_04430 [Chthonomonas sp.]|uniref:hypothetical protein n=1 Tax=Chthonomonas sp. TaxID=2282153 RepID=UPI002B4AF368|nr:hypothetical protein [Chthonomonas sp.]HLI47922.1 hypothetical protein [Chthonomonas sp.]
MARDDRGHLQMKADSSPPFRPCWRCRRYDRIRRLCRDGKANPRRKIDAFALVELLGVRSLCIYNPYRETLARRIYRPNFSGKVSKSKSD